MSGMKASRCALVALAALTVPLTGCQGGVPQSSTFDGGAPSNSDDGGLSLVASATADPGYTLEEFYSDYDGALEIVDDYWTRHWSDYFTGTYSAPGLVSGTEYPPGLYVGGQDQIPCGPDSQGGYHNLKAGNAEYCGPPYNPTNDFIGFDVNYLMHARDYGDMFVYMIVAHEWAHAVQARLHTSLAAQEYELQADCLAGATLQGAADDNTLVLEPGDVEEVSVGLEAIADKYPWGAEGDHGSPEERIAAFGSGASGGPYACLPQ